MLKNAQKCSNMLTNHPKSSQIIPTLIWGNIDFFAFHRDISDFRSHFTTKITCFNTYNMLKNAQKSSQTILNNP
jgi:hypothetical protein